MLIILLSLLNLYASPENCHIRTSDHIYFIDAQKATNKEIIRYSNCPDNIQNSFVEIVKGSKGSVSEFYINSAFTSDFHPYYLEMEPKEIITKQ